MNIRHVLLDNLTNKTKERLLALTIGENGSMQRYLNGVFGRHQRTHIWIVYIERKIAGWGLIEEEISAFSVFIATECRRQGVATAIYRRAERLMRKKLHSSILVCPHSKVAVAFFKSLGYHGDKCANHFIPL